MRQERSMRGLWAWVMGAVLVGIILGFASPVRATQTWHLQLNGVSTTSGGTCGSSALNPWDGTGDYLLGTYFDTGNSGLTFKYSYNNGTNFVTPGSPFGDQQSSPSYLYLFSDGNGGAYQIPTWTFSIRSPFIIRAIGGLGVPDFTCTF